MPRDCITGDQTAECREVEIVAIECLGVNDVYDLETALHHTYFANGLAVHNCQNMDPKHMPVVRESLSHSAWKLRMFSGTSLTPETLLEEEWKASSQAEWFVPCTGCNKWNIPSLEYDLERMIGPWRDDISDHKPGLICARCGRPINPRQGRWKHRHEALAPTNPGFHISQPVAQVHYSDPVAWLELLSKRDGRGGYTEARFKNEVLGEACGKGSQLVSEEELRAAAVLPWTVEAKDWNRAIEGCRNHRFRVLGVDWGGGGVDGVSLTALAVCAYSHDGKVDVVWGCKLRTPNDPVKEAEQCRQVFKAFNCSALSHDFTGSGPMRETYLRQRGVPLSTLRPFRIAFAPAGPIVRYVAAAGGQRWHYVVDKARSLEATCTAIRFGHVRFFQYDKRSNEDPGLLNDFLGLIEDVVPTKRGGDMRLIRRHPHLPDDFAHAVNLGSCSLWRMAKCWPDVAQAYEEQQDEPL